MYHVPNNNIRCARATHGLHGDDVNSSFYLLTLELPYQSNRLVLQFYFKIPTLCYIFSRNDVMTFATITKGVI